MKEKLNVKNNHILKRKAFTLIELLAIIVILTIIATITAPVVLNTIENSKKETVRASAYNYKNTIDNNHLTATLSNKTIELDGIYNIDELKSIGINVNGNEPDNNSWLTIEDNEVIKGCLQFNEYKVDIIKKEISNVEKGICIDSDTYIKNILSKYSENETDGARYINDEIIKYYNPSKGDTCTEEDYNNNLEKTGQQDV